MTPTKQTLCQRCNGKGVHKDILQPELVGNVVCRKCKGTGKSKQESPEEKDHICCFNEIEPDGIHIRCTTCGKRYSSSQAVGDSPSVSWRPNSTEGHKAPQSLNSGCPSNKQPIRATNNGRNRLSIASSIVLNQNSQAVRKDKESICYSQSRQPNSPTSQDSLRAEPLENKSIGMDIVKIYNPEKDLFFHKEDVKSAVEWLKREFVIVKIPDNAIGKNRGKFMKVVFIESINKAFPDITDKEMR